MDSKPVSHWEEFTAVQLKVQEQESKWGIQSHSPEKWLAILGEEFGEFAKAVNEFDKEAQLRELVDLAAVAISALYVLKQFNTTGDNQS